MKNEEKNEYQPLTLKTLGEGPGRGKAFLGYEKSKYTCSPVKKNLGEEEKLKMKGYYRSKV